MKSMIKSSKQARHTVEQLPAQMRGFKRLLYCTARCRQWPYRNCLHTSFCMLVMHRAALSAAGASSVSVITMCQHSACSRSHQRHVSLNYQLVAAAARVVTQGTTKWCQLLCLWLLQVGQSVVPAWANEPALGGSLALTQCCTCMHIRWLLPAGLDVVEAEALSEVHFDAGTKDIGRPHASAVPCVSSPTLGHTKQSPPVTTSGPL